MSKLKQFINEGRLIHNLEKLDESVILNEEVYDWMKDLGLNPKKKYTVKQIENAIEDDKNQPDRKIEGDELEWLRKGGVLKESSEEFAGWIAIDHKGNKLEIDKSEAKDLYGAKQIAIAKLKVPKSKQGLLSVSPAVNESSDELVEGKKITIDVDWNKGYSKYLAKNSKISVKETGESSADLKGTKEDLVKFLKSDTYGLGDDEIEELFPELLETVVVNESMDLEMSFGLLERELSPLQKEYKQYFEDTLAEFDTTSPAKLTPEKKIEFFNSIKNGWVIGKGKKKK
tara:strand:- start:204 stop:1061 length:858 start_codon:yes stop_codon:yes gene_type:complete